MDEDAGRESIGVVNLLTATSLALILWGMLSRRGLAVPLALAGVTGAGAALVAGRVVVPTFYFVAGAALVAVALEWVGRTRPLDHPPSARPGVPWLLLFAAWSVLVTVIAPFVFSGLRIVYPLGGTLLAGRLSTSNVAQLAYLTLGVAVVLYLARRSDIGPGLVGLTTGLTTALSFWRYLYVTFSVPFPEGVLANSPSFAYIETAPQDVPRFRGILSEPSALAGSSLVTMAWCLAMLPRTRGWRRFALLVLASAAVFLGVVSTSTTFLVAGVVSVVVLGASLALALVSSRVSFGPGSTLLAVGLGIASLVVIPTAAAFVQSAVEVKLDSSSFVDRSSADAMSYGIFLRTFPLGAGLGAGRASSLLPTLLSTVGVVGTALLAIAVVASIRAAIRIPAARPTIAVLVTYLIFKVTASPDLSDGNGLVYLCLGVLASQAVGARRAEGGVLSAPPPAQLVRPPRPRR